MRIPRALAVVMIVAYLGCLSWGIGAHTLKMGINQNTLSYFVVWDMFCGWQAYDNRTPLIAEGTSGAFYEVKAPWGEFTPFGNVARIHYDVTNHLMSKHVRNVLSHTAHEPIERIYVIQEIWPKQFNMPVALWNQYFEEPQDVMKYYHVRAVLRDDGSAIRFNPDWYEQQHLMSIADNPRLQRAVQQSQPFYNTFVRPRQSDRGFGSSSQTAEAVIPGTPGLSTN